jgi:hypothetical protein
MTTHADSGQRPRASARTRRMVIFRVGLGLLLSRQFRELMMAGLIGLAALAGLAREGHSRAWVRLAAWDKRRNLRHRRTVSPGSAKPGSA